MCEFKVTLILKCCGFARVVHSYLVQLRPVFLRCAYICAFVSALSGEVCVELNMMVKAGANMSASSCLIGLFYIGQLWTYEFFCS